MLVVIAAIRLVGVQQALLNGISKENVFFVFLMHTVLAVKDWS